VAKKGKQETAEAGEEVKKDEKKDAKK